MKADEAAVTAPFASGPRLDSFQLSPLAALSSALAFVAPLLALWIATHPYAGVIHDARLYMVQALQGLDPGRYARDLFFAYGSQDRFSAFSLIYRPLISAFGPGGAHLAGLIAGEALWLAALLYLTRTVFGSGRAFLFATLAAIALESFYGGMTIFRYGEPFLTPRLLAEAGVLAGVASALRARFVSMAAALLAALALHPLVAIAGVSVVMLMGALQDRRVWWLAGGGALLGLGLGAAEVEPFSRLFVRFDEAWFAVVARRCDFAFLSRWPWTDWLHVAGAAAVLATAWRLGEPAQRRLILAVVLTAAFGLAAAVLLGEVGRIVLVVNLQTWRGLWLAMLLANASAGAIIARLEPGRPSFELFLTAALASLAAAFHLVPHAVPSSLLILACAVLHLEGPGAAPSGFARILARTLAAILCCWLAAVVVLSFGAEGFADRMLRALIALAATALLVRRQVKGAAAWIAALGVVLAGAAVATADSRTAWRKYIEDPAPQPALAAFVRGSGNTYWEGEPGVEMLWLKLRQPSYFSCLQGTGVMFYRGTAMAFEQRSEALKPLATRDFGRASDDLCPAERPPSRLSPALLLAQACRELPDLDTVILTRPIPGAAAATWRSPVPQLYVGENGGLERVNQFFKYDCRSLRP